MIAWIESYGEQISSTITLLQLIFFIAFLWNGLDFLRPRQVDKLRSYRDGYNCVNSVWKDKISILHSSDKVEFGKLPHLMEAQNNQDRITENMLLILSGGGILWLGSVYQGKPDAINMRAIIGGVFLVGALLCIGLIRIYQLRIANFRRGEWYKNSFYYESGEIDIAEMYWRTVHLNNIKRTALGIIALYGLLATMLGYIFILLSTFPVQRG